MGDSGACLLACRCPDTPHSALAASTGQPQQAAGNRGLSVVAPTPAAAEPPGKSPHVPWGVGRPLGHYKGAVDGRTVPFQFHDPAGCAPDPKPAYASEANARTHPPGAVQAAGFPSVHPFAKTKLPSSLCELTNSQCWLPQCQTETGHLACSPNLQP